MRLNKQEGKELESTLAVFTMSSSNNGTFVKQYMNHMN